MEEKVRSLEVQSRKLEKTLQSIKNVFPEPGPATSLLDQVMALQSDLIEALELVEFLQVEKSLEEETMVHTISQVSCTP